MILRAFKCPFCGYRFRADPGKRWQIGETKITRKAETEPVPVEHRRTVDLTCPNCGKEFEVEVEG